MPIYEYECQKCGKVFENFYATYGQSKNVKCPVCSDEKPLKLITSFAGKTGGNSCAPQGGN